MQLQDKPRRSVDLTDVLEHFPDALLIKNNDLQYVWVNSEFEKLFCVHRKDIIGELDRDIFVNRQVAQCNGGDLRVLESGTPDEAPEVVISPAYGARNVVTRKVRATLKNGDTYLIGVILNADPSLVRDYATCPVYRHFLKQTDMQMAQITDQHRVNSVFAHTLDRLVNEEHFLRAPDLAALVA